ncbi:hypothetical protein LIER_40334 [Lithospermum erythrorhizon]|uniref:Uncharacterized protein n=1 Tax=Lithospermum erythrorhizon TaxID=34254 RepID=A0AAV3QW55_LITER
MPSPTLFSGECRTKQTTEQLYKSVDGVSCSYEIAEDMRERWETSDHHKIQDLSETAFGETTSAMSLKEIRRRDPYDCIFIFLFFIVLC